MGVAVGMKFSPNSGFGISLSAVATGTGTAFAMNDCREVWGSLITSGTVSAGTIVLEANNIDIAYAGTWHELDSVDASTLTGGDAYETTRFAGTYSFMRWRITSNLTGGGTVTAYINGLLG